VTSGVDDELADVLDAALALAGEPLPHLREPVGRREAHDQRTGGAMVIVLVLAVGPGLVGAYSHGIKAQDGCPPTQPCWSNSDGTSKRTAGERAVVLLELSEGAVGERMITFGAEEFVNTPRARARVARSPGARERSAGTRDRFRLRRAP